MRRRRGTLKWAGGAIVLCVLCISVPFLANRLKAKSTRISVETAVDRLSCTPDDPEQFYDFVASLPSYRLLDERLCELGEAGSELLEAAAQEDSDALVSAAVDFRVSIRQLQFSCEQLSDRIGKEQAESILQDAIEDLEADYLWRPDELLLAGPHQ